MDSLLKDAIADAKTVRETALENAKLALTEAFTPTLQSMLSQKLREEDDEMDMDMDDKEEDEEAEEAPAMDAEAGDEDHEPGHDADEGHGEDHDEEEGEEEDERMMAKEEEGEEEDERMSEEEGEEHDEDDLDLEAIIRELEEEAGEDEDERDDMKEEEDADEDKEEMDEQSDSSGIGKSDNKVDQASGDDYEKAETEKSSKAPGAENADDKKVDDLKDHIELDLDSIIREIEGLDEEEEVTEEVEENNELEEVKKSLEEHREVIVHLREKINEVNLLNAKLLYTNKLFRNHNLNDGQKLKVVETFDRATNIREVKLVFTTLAESFDGVRVTTKKRSVNESVASKAVASTKPKQEIVEESNDVADRFKQLAGLIK